MTKVLFVLVLLISCVGISAAPSPQAMTPQQFKDVETLKLCKADREAWILEESKDVYLKDLSWRELDRRANVATDCIDAIVEPTNGKSPEEILNPTNPVVKEARDMRPIDYVNLAYLHQRIMIHRLKDFMNRHHLVGQFEEEDARGIGR